MLILKFKIMKNVFLLFSALIVLISVSTAQTIKDDPIPDQEYCTMMVVRAAFAAYDSNSWERDGLISDLDRYQDYDAIIWGDTAIHLYKFTKDFNPLLGYWLSGGEEWVKYRESYCVATFSMPHLNDGNTLEEREVWSHALMEGFKGAFKYIVDHTPSTVYGVKNVGHGGTADRTFLSIMNAEDTQELFQYWNNLIGRKLDFFDMHTTCEESSLYNLSAYAKYFDYVMVSDLNVGGYQWDNWIYEEYLAVEDMEQYPYIMNNCTYDLIGQLSEIMDLLEARWDLNINSIIEEKVKQSDGIFESSKYARLINELKKIDDIENVNFEDYNDDLFTYIKSLDNSVLESYLTDFRIHYISNKDFFTWDTVTFGIRMNYPIDSEFVPYPVLVVPEYKATRIPLETEISWLPLESASSYSLQISTNYDFSSPIVNETNIQTNSYAFSGINQNTQYYWRVKSNEVGEWSEIWRFTSLSDLPEIVHIISPKNGSLEVDTSPFVEWNSSFQADEYHLQLSVISNFSSLIFENSSIADTSLQLINLDQKTKYYIRVRGVNSEGQGEWSVVNYFLTYTDLPAVPIIIFPVDYYNQISTSCEYHWFTAARANTYHLQVSPFSDFSSLIFEETEIVDTTIRSKELMYNTKYYWHVRAENDFGFGDWTSTSCFTTGQPYDGIPKLYSPINGARDVSTDSVLCWSPWVNAISYHLQIAATSDFTSVLFDENTLTSNLYDLVGLEYSTSYFWRINVTTSEGTTEWSEHWSFRTMSGLPADFPAAPILTYPRYAMTNAHPSYCDFTWDASARASSYHVQASTISDFSVLIFEADEITETSIRPPELMYNTKYYWRVRAKNDYGYSDWSEEFWFITDMPNGGIPRLYSPSNNATDISIDSMLCWSPWLDVLSYHLQIATTMDFTTVMIDESTLTSNLYDLVGLEYSTTYFWRMNAATSETTTAWSAPWSFKTSGSTVGFNETPSTINSKVYPNPSSGLLTLSELPESGCIIKIYNMIGVLIKTIESHQSEILINISDQPPGLYYISTEGENRLVVKIIKR